MHVISWRQIVCFINQNDFLMFSNRFRNYYIIDSKEKHSRLNGGHLGFHDGRQIYKVENVSSAIVDLKNVYLVTKIMFLLYLEADM